MSEAKSHESGMAYLSQRLQEEIDARNQWAELAGEKEGELTTLREQLADAERVFRCIEIAPTTAEVAVAGYFKRQSDTACCRNVPCTHPGVGPCDMPADREPQRGPDGTFGIVARCRHGIPLLPGEIAPLCCTADREDDAHG